MTELWVSCEHRRREPHWLTHDRPYHDDNTCPGGHPATVEEVVEWLAQSEFLHREQSWSVMGHHDRLVTDWRKVKKAQDV